MTSRRFSLLLLFTALTPAIASAEGMLLPGWGPIADQALADIQAAALEGRPAAENTSGSAFASDASAAGPVISAFINSQGHAAEERDIQARLDQLTAQLWRAHAGQGAGEANGADRVARAFTLSNASTQLASSVYGGAPGAAAYAAWWAMRQPGATAERALDVGLLAGAEVWGAQKETGGASVATAVSQRTSLAAALGGLAVAAAGGDDQALRELFFDTGAAVLVPDNGRVYCLSATVQCQPLPAQAAVNRNGYLQGWALDRLTPVVNAPPAPLAETPPPAATPAATPAQGSGSLNLGEGWALSWQLPVNPEHGLFYPAVVLAHGAVPPAPAPATRIAAEPEAEPATEPSAVQAPLPELAGATSRYLCERGKATRSIWVIPGDAKAGYVCKTMYQVDKTRSVLWNAKQSPYICQAKAKARAALEQSRGYTCRLVE